MNFKEMRENKILRFFIGHEDPINLYESCPILGWIIIGAILGPVIYLLFNL